MYRSPNIATDESNAKRIWFWKILPICFILSSLLILAEVNNWPTIGVAPITKPLTNKKPISAMEDAKDTAAKGVVPNLPTMNVSTNCVSATPTCDRTMGPATLRFRL